MSSIIHGLKVHMFRSELVKFGTDEGPNSLIKTCQNTKALQISAPVKRNDRLCRYMTTVQQLYGACHAHGNVVLVILYAGLRVVVLVEVEASIAAARHKKITILR